jgi:hypothetical protein
MIFMNKSLLKLAGLAGLLLLNGPSAIAAVPEIKPGLWEVTAKWDVPPPDLSKMTAEEKDRYEKGRAEREERMKQAQQPRPICITGEMVSKGHWFGAGRRSAECEYSKVTTTAKLVTYEVSCTGGPRQSTGKGKLSLVSSTKFTGETLSQGQGPGGQSRTVKVSTSGTWKAADCGATTPQYPNIKK